MTSQRTVIIGLVATALSCGGGALGGPGTGAAGTGGGGGSGGTSAGGSGGGDFTGGSGGAMGLPACDLGAPLVVWGTISANGAALKAPVTATVTVTDRVMDADTAAAHFTLKSTTTSEEWYWDERIPDLPTDLIKVGDTFDLTVNAGETSWAFSTYTFQTVVLSRNGVLVAFTANLWNGIPLVPPLTAWGINVFDGGPTCEIPSSGFCGYRYHIAQVVVDRVSVLVTSNQTVTVNGVSFSVGNFVEPFVEVGDGVCHEARRSAWAGFRQSGAGGTTGAGGGAGGTTGAGGAGGTMNGAGGRSSGIPCTYPESARCPGQCGDGARGECHFDLGLGIDCSNSFREWCDGADLGAATCASRGLGSGTLRCASDCGFDTSGCSGAPGGSGGGAAGP